jgi:predicted transcriptional regulator of viral defense system
MKTSVLLTKLRLENKEFVTSDELKAYCRSMKLDYDLLVRYFESRGYLLRIFRGIFYVKPLEELKLGRSKYNYLELVARGLELKKVRNWYFGLHTALKLNNMTHEHFTIEEVVNDSIFRSRPMKIAGYSFKFVKLSPSLLNFGIIGRNGIRYSDPEKTILDFIYIWRYNGIPEDKIVVDVSDWSKGVSKTRAVKYAKNYPTTVSNIVKKVIE